MYDKHGDYIVKTLGEVGYLFLPINQVELYTYYILVSFCQCPLDRNACHRHLNSRDMLAGSS